MEAAPTKPRLVVRDVFAVERLRLLICPPSQKTKREPAVEPPRVQLSYLECRL